MLKVIIFLLISVFSFNKLFAEDIPIIVISAGKSAQSYSSVGSTVTVIDSETIQNSPNTFLTVGLAYGEHINETRILDASFHAIKIGADAIYCPQGLKLVEVIADEGIPVIGHVGFVPYKASIFGGFKAVGKTAKEAIKTLELTKAYQDAGAIGVEIEIVPHKVATYISQNVDILLISMGSGNGCDAQYLFADDILGYNKGHIPRHAKVYCDHKSEYERLFKDKAQEKQGFE